MFFIAHICRELSTPLGRSFGRPRAALWLTNTTFYHWHEVPVGGDRMCPDSRAGRLENATRPCRGRDTDVLLSWTALQCMLGSIGRLRNDRQAYERESHDGPRDTCREVFKRRKNRKNSKEKKGQADRKEEEQGKRERKEISNSTPLPT